MRREIYYNDNEEPLPENWIEMQPNSLGEQKIDDFGNVVSAIVNLGCKRCDMVLEGECVIHPDVDVTIPRICGDFIKKGFFQRRDI